MNNIKLEENFEVEDLELELFIQALYYQYGYDFREYSRAHLKRRVLYRMSVENLSSISVLQDKILHNKDFFYKIIGDFSINVTEMFRDPSFYRKIKEKVIPILKTYPYLKIWHAGCSTGEEVYSMAILLKEEGLLEKTQIYATDFSESALEIAKEGIYPMDLLKKYSINYHKAGGSKNLADYYSSMYGYAKFDHDLRKKIVFSSHNLVNDGVFGEMHMIICRNVLIYFNRTLQERVLELFEESLVRGGILGVGSKESISFTSIEKNFEEISANGKLYKKKYYKEKIK